MTVTPDSDESDLVVTPEVIARRAGISGPLSPEQRATVVDVIRDAQADVVAYLGQAITPVTITETDRYPWAGGWRLDQAPDADITFVSVVPQVDALGAPTDYFTVTYRAGLDAANDPELRPILRYVTAHALNSPDFVRLWKTATNTQGEIRTVSAEGQSISFGSATLGGGGNPGTGAPGALPTLAALDRWRVAGRRVYQAATRYGRRELY